MTEIVSTRGDVGAGEILGGSKFVNLSPIFIIVLVFSMYYQHKEPLFKVLGSENHF